VLGINVRFKLGMKRKGVVYIRLSDKTLVGEGGVCVKRQKKTRPG